MCILGELGVVVEGFLMCGFFGDGGGFVVDDAVFWGIINGVLDDGITAVVDGLVGGWISDS